MKLTDGRDLPESKSERFFFFNSSKVDLQCVNFCCTNVIVYIHIHI